MLTYVAPDDHVHVRLLGLQPRQLPERGRRLLPPAVPRAVDHELAPTVLQVQLHVHLRAAQLDISLWRDCSVSN